MEDKTRDAAKGHGKDRLLKAWDYLDAAGMPQEAPASKMGESKPKMKWVKGKRKVSSRAEGRGQTFTHSPSSLEALMVMYRTSRSRSLRMAHRRQQADPPSRAGYATCWGRWEAALRRALSCAAMLWHRPRAW